MIKSLMSNLVLSVNIIYFTYVNKNTFKHMINILVFAPDKEEFDFFLNFSV